MNIGSDVASTTSHTGDRPARERPRGAAGATAVTAGSGRVVVMRISK